MHKTITLAAMLLCAAIPAWALEARAVKTATDKTGNWLVEHYDLKERTFGKGAAARDLTTQAMIVTALCNSPRDYKEANGPYISEPVKYLLSAIKDDASIKDVEARTWVQLALKSTKNQKYADQIVKLKGDLPLVKPENPSEARADKTWLQGTLFHLQSSSPDKASAEKLAESLIKLQQKNGSFGEDLQVNALALQVLTVCYKAMK